MADERDDLDDDDFDDEDELADAGEPEVDADQASEAELEDLAGEGDGSEDEIDPDELLDPKARASRSLEIRRRLEERDEERRLKADLDYLDEELDFDD